MSLPSGLEEWRRKLAPSRSVVPRRAERQCVNDAGQPKARHRTEAAAEHSLKILRLRPGYVERTGRPVNIYNCPLCQFWHIGRTPEKGRKHAEERQPEQPGSAAGPARDPGGQQQPPEQQAPPATAAA